MKIYQRACSVIAKIITGNGFNWNYEFLSVKSAACTCVRHFEAWRMIHFDVW